MDDVLEFLYELLPPWLATSILGGLGLGAGLGGLAWHSHEAASVTACNTFGGQVAQAVSGSARVSCGGSALLSKVAVVLEVGGFLVFGIAVVVFVVLAGMGKLRRAEG